MAFPPQLLNDHETIILDRHPHWTYLAGVMSMAALAVLVCLVLAIIQPALLAVGAVLLVIVGVGCLGRYLRWQNTRFVLTDERMIIRTGIIAKSGLEIPLDRVTNVAYHQSLFDRLFNAGDLIVESAGELGQQRFQDVGDPQNLQRLLYKYSQLDSERMMNTSSRGQGEGRGGSSAIPSQIEQLAKLRDDGILSDEEFNEKKAELLDRL